MDLTFQTEEYLYKDLTDKIIKHYYKVYNTLGYGFLENVYQNALFFELMDNGFECEAQKEINVYYSGICVGNYKADIVVNDLIITHKFLGSVITPVMALAATTSGDARTVRAPGP